MKPRSLVFAQMPHVMLVWMLVLAAVTFYRGHHLPGGGFIGGLVGALTFLLLAIGQGTEVARRTMRVDPFMLLWLGIGTALCSLGLGFIGGEAGFDGLWLPEYHVPLLGAVHLGTPMLFDLGVFLAVMGFATKVGFGLQEDNV
jgi:multicomponent Na+:H+ antiporter subunit B